MSSVSGSLDLHGIRVHDDKDMLTRYYAKQGDAMLRRRSPSTLLKLTQVAQLLKLTQKVYSS